MRFGTSAGCVTGTLMLPLFWAILAGSHAAILALWVGIALPTGCLTGASLWRQRPLAVHERNILAGTLIVGLCFSLLLAGSHARLPSLYLGGMILLMSLNAIASGLRCGPVLALVAGLVAEFAVAIGSVAALGWTANLALTLLLGACAACAVFGNWRLETEIRRGYALALRERLARDLLACRNAELDALAGHDALTSLPNRRTYDRWLALQWASALQGRTPIGLAIIDIDHFKAYNDHYGHAAGDACLRAVAQCLREQSRGVSDHVARFGGEEFAVLLPGLSAETCAEVANRLRAAVAAMRLPHPQAPAPKIVTVSCGTASLVPAEPITAEDLFEAADAALYAAKAAGRNCVRLEQVGVG
jgi:diguanylate cyclase (GGDEF)-like protein